ncbi:two-component system sensor histidine kinase DesK [Actinomadura pelletieri DSM 43383]|uniref:Two-component system sensor histidine kinase DesK n=1 Tax=Actinomadura pelletieri DSM 43383 TaxID=1120940 RepID=A0A495QNP2_9ACTN|nr:sensor histidine kinase [Actinomadura pelletieri]RKS74539.1 two-component system sensor histidine kinase DesK [Actinomadura pelletieri DSM 43383]
MTVATTADLEARDTQRLERYQRVTYRSFLIAAVGFVAPSLVGLGAAYTDDDVGVPLAVVVLAGLVLLTWYYARLVKTGLAGGASRRDLVLSGTLAAAMSTMILIGPLFNLIPIFWVSAVVMSPLSRRQLVALCVAVGGVCSVLTTISVQRLAPDAALPWYGVFPLMFVIYVGGCAVTVFVNRYQRRMWEMHRETHAARDALARLAVTEERLRFSRDLHDLLGHSLSLIAVKSELAMRTARTDPDRAATEMADVRRTAREALREVRAAVSGYRAIELDTELVGARAVLEAAGIRCEIGDPQDALPSEVRSVLAWIIREGVTNVIKHSGARRCEVTLTAYDGSVVLEMGNDGVRGDGGVREDGSGSGLTGLAERVAVLGGEITAGRHGRDGFLLRAVVPLPASDADAVPAGTAAGRTA